MADWDRKFSMVGSPRTQSGSLRVWKNATKRAPLERSAAAFDPAIKDLLGTNATKPEYCSRAPRTELTEELQTDDFGTPISIGGRWGGRPKGVSPASRWYPARLMYDLCYTPLRNASGLHLEIGGDNPCSRQLSESRRKMHAT